MLFLSALSLSSPNTPRKELKQVLCLPYFNLSTCQPTIGAWMSVHPRNAAPNNPLNRGFHRRRGGCDNTSLARRLWGSYWHPGHPVSPQPSLSLSYKHVVISCHVSRQRPTLGGVAGTGKATEINHDSSTSKLDTTGVQMMGD